MCTCPLNADATAEVVNDLHVLSNLQGTAATEAAELFDVYGLSVVEVPTNKPSRRKHMGRLLFLDQKEKYVRLLDEVRPRSPNAVQSTAMSWSAVWITG